MNIAEKADGAAADEAVAGEARKLYAEARMTEHMNSDHVGAMRDYCALFGVDPGGEAPRLAAIDGEGFDLVIGKRLLRVGFDQPVAAVEEVRAAMVALARRARARAGALA